jgi:hypothetical protein
VICISTFRAAVLLGVLATGLMAQQQLNNESILKLHEAGLGEDMIVNMVNTQPGQYAVAVDDVVALKRAGVSEKVIAAMMSKNNAPASNLPATAPPVQQGGAPPAVYPTEVGVYYMKNDKWVEVLPEVINWKTGGVLKTVATIGTVKRDLNGWLNGPNSRNAVRIPLEFLIYAPEGVAMTEYQLLRLRVAKDGREFRTVTGGFLHSSGGAARDLLLFDGKKIASRTYLVTPANLGPGEYGFLPPGSAAGGGSSAQIGKMYTFHAVE